MQVHLVVEDHNLENSYCIPVKNRATKVKYRIKTSVEVDGISGHKLRNTNFKR